MNNITIKAYEHIGEGLFLLLGNSLVTTARFNVTITDLLADMDAKLRELRFLNLMPEIIWRFKSEVRQIVLCFYAVSASIAEPNSDFNFIQEKGDATGLQFSFEGGGKEKGKVKFVVYRGAWKVEIKNPTGQTSTLVEVKEAAVQAPEDRQSQESAEQKINSPDETNIDTLTQEEALRLLK